MERPPLPPLHPIHEVDSIYVVSSALSTSGEKAPALTDGLQTIHPDIRITHIATTGTDQEANREILWKEVDTGYDQGYIKPMIIAAGGDGTTHYVGKDMLHPRAPEHIRKALLTPWGLGQENDLFACLHDPRMQGSTDILSHKNGHVIAGHFLKLWGLVDGTFFEDIALGYVTLGSSADAAALLAGNEHRQYRRRFPGWMRTLVDMRQTAPIVLGRPDVVQAKPDFFRPKRPITEVGFNNAERMAGRGNFSRSTGLDDPGMHYAELNSNRPWDVIKYAARIAMGVPSGERVRGPVTVWFEKGGLHGEIDGEVIRSNADQKDTLGTVTFITVEPSDKTLRYYATKKPQNRSYKY